MKTFDFTYIAFTLGLLLMLVIVAGSTAGDDGSTIMPLLTLLFISEFSFVVTAIGSFTGFKNIQSNGFKPVTTTITILCILLSGLFITAGISLWPA